MIDFPAGFSSSLNPVLALLLLGFIPGLPGAAQSFDGDLSSPEAAEKINLIPTPQQLELGDRRRDTNQFYIARPDGSPRAQSGAQEINRRVEGLGGHTLPVKDSFDGGRAIVLATWDTELGSTFADRLNVSDGKPGEQGYVIEMLKHNGEPVVAVIGSDPTGTFYAAVTLRRLIRPAESGPQLLEARVRDHPAFARRSIGIVWINNEPHPERYIRWLGRHKINYINLRGSWLYDSKGQHRKHIINRVRELTNMAAVKGHVQLEWMRARRLSKYGRPLEAQYKLRELLEDLPEFRKRVEQVENRIREYDQLSWRPEQKTYRWSGSGLTELEIKVYRQSIKEQIEQLKSGAKRIPASIVD